MIVTTALFLMGACSAANASEGADTPILHADAAAVSFDGLTEPPAAEPTDPPPTEQQLTEKAARVEFGDADTQWWALGAGVSYDFDDATDTNIFGQYRYFVAKDVEFIGEAGAWYYSQPGDDALSLNLSMLFRWHFYNDREWTLYGDVGIGVMFATDEVPDEGKSFNFTPRAGVGFTHLLNDDGLRLEVGVRWAHTSNARISGDLDNPARDAIMLHAGVIFPFK
jgi:hypothetical protein